MNDSPKHSRESIIVYLEAEALRQLGYADTKDLHKDVKADAFKAYEVHTEAVRLLRMSV